MRWKEIYAAVGVGTPMTEFQGIKAQLSKRPCPTFEEVLVQSLQTVGRGAMCGHCKHRSPVLYNPSVQNCRVDRENIVYTNCGLDCSSWWGRDWGWSRVVLPTISCGRKLNRMIYHKYSSHMRAIATALSSQIGRT